LLALYLAALLAALGVFVLQLAFGHHDAGGLGHDAGHGGGHEAGTLSLFASTRFWTFALLAFGLVGTLLTVFALAGKVTIALVAAGAGVASGLFAASVIRRLTRQGASSHGTTGDVIGRVGRVVVPLDATGPGKVRIAIKGSDVDYVARSREKLEVEDAVVVEECNGNEVVVSRAPRELKP
jgi:membrane protein implicated in regulation of membrane protease activity